MSEENVEIVRRAFEALYRKPEPDLATMNALFDPDHEFISRSADLEGGSHRGMRGYRDWQKEFAETMESESTVESVRELDGDRVLVVLPTSFRGKQSGIALDSQSLGVLVTLRETKIVRTEVHPSPDEALEAAGLQE
jgi:ketosteroid isomerase-like protein